MKNYGVILGRRDSDYIGGSLPYEVRNPSGDWTQYLPQGEWQRTNAVDSMACVTFSALNSIETQFKLLTGIDRNFSDRFTAKMSGTTGQGNYLYKVADSIRKDGLVDEAVWPTAENFDWNAYYAEIPQEIKDKAKEFFNEWDVKDEDIPFDRKSLMYHLKHAPIQVVIPGHAILGVFSTKDVTKIFDSYEPFLKNVPGQYPGPLIAAKKLVLYKKEHAIPDEFLLVDIKLGDTGRQVEKLLNALARLGWKLDFTPTSFVYDASVADLVSRFKLANTCSSFWARWIEKYYLKGRSVVDWEREIINNLIK